jgi:hypothetical protein
MSYEPGGFCERRADVSADAGQIGGRGGLLGIVAGALDIGYVRNISPRFLITLGGAVLNLVGEVAGSICYGA